MVNTQKKGMSTKTLVLGAILTALVFLLQILAVALRGAGLFTISLVLVPIVIGAATCGCGIGAWLGFVFGVSVLISGDASPFLAVNALGTVLTVLLKGTLCGYLAGLAYKAFEKVNRYLATFVSAIVCPLVNTGVFLLGCLLFFMPTIREWALGLGFGDNVSKYMILGLVGVNFLIELGINIVLSPIIVRLLNIREKQL
ncbi:MAG: ECF transporter S component [Clostridia bacterium]|nr:ECF transporter S component [Clostridia bacterium]